MKLQFWENYPFKKSPPPYSQLAVSYQSFVDTMLIIYIPIVQNLQKVFHFGLQSVHLGLIYIQHESVYCFADEIFKNSACFTHAHILWSACVTAMSSYLYIVKSELPLVIQAFLKADPNSE